MNLAEILNSRFLNEEDNSSKMRIFLESAGMTAFSYLVLYQVDKDFSNQIMTLPDFMHGRMHDFMAGAVFSSLGRFMFKKRRSSMTYGFISGTFGEFADLITDWGVYDTGDIFAYALGSTAWGTVNYAVRRGSERLRHFDRLSGSPPPSFSN